MIERSIKEIQRVILGLIVLEPEIYMMDLIENTLTEDHFVGRTDQVIYRAMQAIAEKSDYLDIGLLLEQVTVNGDTLTAEVDDRIMALIEDIPSTIDIKPYIEKIVEHWTRRRIHLTSKKISVNALNPVHDVDSLLNELDTINDLKPEESGILTIDKASDEAMTEINEMAKNPFTYDKITTGYLEIDNRFRVKDGDLIIIAARPSIGKSTLALNFLLNMAQEGKKGILFSLEMSAKEIAKKFLGNLSQINTQIMDTKPHELSEDEWTRLASAKAQIKDLPILIDDKMSSTIRAIRSKCERIKRQQGLDLVVIDYLQLMQGKGGTTVEIVSGLSRDAKCLARELGVPVFLLSQLNRNSEHEKRVPKLTDLRDSGSIEQDADSVLFLHDPTANKYDGDKPLREELEIICAKQRGGERNWSESLDFLKPYSRFENKDHSQPV